MGRVKDTGYVNPQDVYNYLVVNKGLSREHALGMLANIQGESGFKISIQEYGKAAGTGGVGLYQHTGSRRTKLMQYTGGNISDWTKQVDFALQEADTKRYLAQTFKTPEEASIWFTTKWERPANAQQRAQERLKYLNNYSSFSGYESEYVPTTNTSTDQAEQTGGIPPQTVIPFEVVIAGQPVQANFSYEEFEKALLTVKKTEEKTEESPARQELEEQTTTQEEFLKAISSLSAPPASDDSAQGASQQQGFALGTGPYTPVEIPEMQGQLPQMPNLFSTQLPQMQDGGEPGDKFKQRLMRRNPGMQSVYGPEGENLNIVKDPNYDAGSKPYYAGDIEFMFPGLPQVSYKNKDDETLPDYVYKNPSPDKYTSVYNPRGANRADIFLDMLHGMRDDQNYEVLLQNFDKAVRDARGGDMQYYYEQDVANDNYTDGQEQWNQNYVDGQLRAQLAPGTIGMFSHGRRDYRKERRYDTPEMRQAAEDIRNYLKNSPTQSQNNTTPQMRDGGPTKTIDGVQYVQDEQGNWKYASGAPVTDRALAQRLQYEQSSTTQGAPKVTPATIRAQQVANQKNSPSLSQQKEYAQAQKAKKELELAQAKQQAYEQAIAKTKLQSVQPADWVFAAPALGLTAGADALSALGSLAATQIPGTGLSVGTAVNTAGGIHGATQFDDRVVDWQDVVAGDMDWKEAATKSFLTGVEVMGGYGAARQGFNTAKEIYAAGKGVNIYQARPVEMPVRPDLSYLGITPEQQDLLNLQQVNSTTMLSSDMASPKLKMLGEDYRSPDQLPAYMTPYQYPADQIARRFSPWQNSYFKTLEVEKAADRIIRRTTDDKVYYDLNGNIVKTPADNLQRGGKVSAQETKEMVDGIAQILAQVNNAKNRSDIARNMIYDFEQEGLNYNLNKFLRDANVR